MRLCALKRDCGTSRSAAGFTEFLTGTLVDLTETHQVNAAAVADGGQLAATRSEVMGIIKAIPGDGVLAVRCLLPGDHPCAHGHRY